MILRTLAPAKINVCLFLGPVRESDGRHELVSVMQSISLADRVRLEVLEEGPDEVLVRDSDVVDTLATRAVAGLRERGVPVPPVRLTIGKRIPVAGGMAGGSADAGAALRLAARAAGGADPDVLHAVAATLGADVPAQVKPGRVLASGAGEVLERVPGTPPYAVVVLPHPVGLPTADVFREADRLGLSRDAAALEEAARTVRDALPDLPDALCTNELEPAVLSLRPELAHSLDALRDAGADVALVSGSGPTTLGLFRDVALARRAAREVLPGAKLAEPVGPDAGEVLAS